jgi:lipopolysaccharide biosynthesis glycosyltransferase
MKNADNKLINCDDNDPKYIPIVLAVDDNYAMQLAVVIRSMLENFKSDRQLIIYVMDGGIKDINKRLIIKSLNSHHDRIKIEWLEVSDNLATKNFKISGHVSIATYFRLLIPDLLPQRYEKVIYLDSDIIVNYDISQLWDIDIGEKYLLAVQDLGILNVSSPNGLIDYQNLGISPDAKYFNAGVLVINLKKWRSEGIAEKIVDYLENNHDFVRFWDQDGLNAILVGHWGELDPRWNQTPSIHKYSSWEESPFSEAAYNHLIHDPYIIHFAQAAKPWNSREYHPANQLFFKYVDLTAWKGWRFSIWRRLWGRAIREIQQVKK